MSFKKNQAKDRIIIMTALKRFEWYMYEVGNCKKDLSLSINLEDFDRSKLSLVVNDLNEDNYTILYDGRKFRLYVDELYAKVKHSRTFDQEYLTIKDVYVKAKERLMKVFSAIKELVQINTKEESEQNCYIN